MIAVLYFTSQTASAVDGIPCDTGEHVRTGDHHYHAHLQIIWHGTDVNVPANTGIPPTGNCLYWLHTHDTTGVIHIEAPADKDHGFTLGQFFAVWHQPLNSKQVAGVPIAGGDQLVVYVNGQRYEGDPNKIKLTAHELIVLEITPPLIDPPPTYSFAQGL
ncbi:MAG TPA: hypothetical protein VF134_00795 [Candidatus Dormibacteraeota bacterium]